MTIQHATGDELARIKAKHYSEITTDEWCALPFDDWRAKGDERRAAEAACPAHEAVSLSSSDELRRGWYRARCKHCGADMSRDSGD
jgi:hypothetical protein